MREAGVAVALVIAVVLAVSANPRFASPENLRAVLLAVPLMVMVAMGEMMVILSRNIDLSVGSIMGFSGQAVGMLFIAYPDLPIWFAILLGVLIGGALGVFNGVLVASFRVPAIIATLGTLYLYRGLVFILSGGKQVDPNYIPFGLIRLSQEGPVGLPWIVVGAAIIALMTHLFLTYTDTGRQVYAMGSNSLAARLRGIEMSRLLLLVFALAGCAAGLAGVMYASRFGYVNPGVTGVGFELTVIAATVLGGTSVAGGSGSVLGTVLGCLLLGVLSVALAVAGVGIFWQTATYGLCIIFALVLDSFVRWRLTAVRGGEGK